MKSRVYFVLGMLFVLSMGLYAQENDWTEDVAAARAKAKETGKYILINFSGSDWCGWCKKLNKEVFLQDDFLNYASKNLILLNADFPKFKKQHEKIKGQNETLLKTYGVRGFPTVIIVSPTGELAGQTGYRPGGAKKYAAHVQEIIDKYNES